MKDDKIRVAAHMLKVASNQARLTILLLLAEGETNAGEIAAAVGSSGAVTSHHLKFLRLSRLADRRRVGKNVVYSLTDQGRTLQGAFAALCK